MRILDRGDRGKGGRHRPNGIRSTLRKGQGQLATGLSFGHLPNSSMSDAALKIAQAGIPAVQRTRSRSGVFAVHKNNSSSSIPENVKRKCCIS